MSVDRVELLTRVATPLATSLGLELWGVELVGSSRPVARLYVDKSPLPPTVIPVMTGSAQTDSHTKGPDGISPEAAACASDGIAHEGVTRESVTHEGITRESVTYEGVTREGITREGITIDQCANLSRLVGLTLDVEDPFADNWVLEVSSPGLERPFFAIDQLRVYTDREIDVVLDQPHPEWPGRKKFCGLLSMVADETFTLALPLTARKDDEPETVVIAWPDVRKAHLVHTFPQTTRPGRKKAGAAKDASGGIA